MSGRSPAGNTTSSPSRWPEHPGGSAMTNSSRAAGIEILSGALAWGAFEPLDLMVHDGERSRHYRPKRLVVAAGAYERGVPFPGWTLPGVMTSGAAQTL